MNRIWQSPVLGSGHPLLGRMPWYIHLLGGRASLAAEFLLLIGALLMTHYVAPAWAWGYLAYSVLNGIGAWLILARRV